MMKCAATRNCGGVPAPLLAAVVALGITGCTKVSTVAAPAGPTPEVQALLDRAAIENLYAEYYANFGGDDHDFAKYYTTDGELDVNGMVAKGADAITAMYVQSSGGEDTPRPSKDPKAPPVGKWLIQHRTVTSYGGMPKSLLKSYVVR